MADHARILVDACLATRRPDGMFHNVLDDPATFEEGTIAEMLLFAVASGIADGWLPETYTAVAQSLWATVRSLPDDRGVVQRVCGAPHFDRQGISVEAQAFSLLASAAYRRLDPPIHAPSTL